MREIVFMVWPLNILEKQLKLGHKVLKVFCKWTEHILLVWAKNANNFSVYPSLKPLKTLNIEHLYTVNRYNRLDE